MVMIAPDAPGGKGPFRAWLIPKFFSPEGVRENPTILGKYLRPITNSLNET